MSEGSESTTVDPPKKGETPIAKEEPTTKNGEATESEKAASEVALSEPEPVLKHPLQHAWTMWFFKNNRAKEWKVNQKPIITFKTVEDFWALYNHIEVSSKIEHGCDYSLFKEGIWPMWEDEANSGGGRWLITLEKKQRHAYLDDFWLEVMLCLIGESFDEYSEIINGAVVSVRPRHDKIAIWLGDASKGNMIITIGKKVKERLGIEKQTTLGFEAHDDTMKKSGSVAKLRYTV
uniref:eIF-4F 25 kDa subunit n=1 Tax=Lepeophtheirus salmonis TaxID=72036 RepID=D3PJZ3_LEPSM|nr:Eukaryotic translation initiation factor 4E [Lepeophtheirus salmonis]